MVKEEKKETKSWFKRHPIWTGVIIIFGIVIFQNMFSGMQNSEVKTTNTQSNSAPQTSYTPNNDVQNTPQTKEEPKVLTAKTYALNENINVDYLTYKVTKVEEFTKMGTSVYEKTTNGKFVKVYLEITNNAKETKQIFTPRFKIEDNQERKYDRLSDDMMYIADYLQLGVQLQPGLTASGAIVFEMPKDSQDLKLIVNGDWVSISEVKVSLTNIKNIGTDTTNQDKIDAMMNSCNAPFKCSSTCAEYSDVGQKNCASGQVCCMK